MHPARGPGMEPAWFAAPQNDEVRDLRRAFGMPAEGGDDGGRDDVGLAARVFLRVAAHDRRTAGDKQHSRGDEPNHAGNAAMIAPQLSRVNARIQLDGRRRRGVLGLEVSLRVLAAGHGHPAVGSRRGRPPAQIRRGRRFSA